VLKIFRYRKAYHEIEKALKLSCFPVIILLGLRKTGKTTILRQLSENHDGFYHDFKANILSYEQTEDLFERSESLLCFDEIGYLDCFDLFMSSLVERAGSANKKVVITSSAYGAMKQLGSEHLGGGRSHKVELFPLSFEEYLHFTQDGFDYGDDYEPTVQDVDDFYRLKNVPLGMDFIIDRQYMLDTFNDIETSRANRFQTERDVVLTKEQYTSVLDILAYTLNDNISMKRLKGSQLGAQEFISTKGISISKSLIGLANKIVSAMSEKIVKNLGIEDLAHVVAYLYHSGFLFVDLKRDENKIQQSDRVIHELLSLCSFNDFKNFFIDYNFCVISPLLYTRLLIDLEFIADKEFDNPSLYGKLYELAVKSEFVQYKKYDIYHESCKFKSAVSEIDLCAQGLLLEATIKHKKRREFFVNDVLVDRELIRVLTDECGIWKFNETFYRIGYPKALLMISNGTIFNLQATKVITQD